MTHPSQKEATVNQQRDAFDQWLRRSLRDANKLEPVPDALRDLVDGLALPTTRPCPYP